MRQWMVNPKLLCDRHLLGEHVEHHMFVGTINKGISIDGYLKNKLLNPSELHIRHEELVLEMNTRGFNHKSNLVDFIVDVPNIKTVNIDENLSELKRRCIHCKSKIEKYLGENL